MSEHKTTEWHTVGELFLDLKGEKLFADGSREKHDTPAEGYQRDRSGGRYGVIEPDAETPFKEFGVWVANRVGDDYSEAAMRPIEISKRKMLGSAAKFAIIDGGGRWLLKIAKFGLDTEIECRVHEDLTRQDEARLFREFDEVERLGSVDLWQAQFGQGEKDVVEMANAIAPLTVAKKAKAGVLNCPGVVTTIYDKAGPKLLSQTAKAVTNTWAALDKGTFNGYPVDGVAFSSLGIVIEAAQADQRKWDQVALYKVLKKKELSAASLRRAINDVHMNTKVNTAQRKLTGAWIIGKAYNTAVKPERRIPMSVNSMKDIAVLRETQIASALFKRQKSKKSPFEAHP